MKIKRLTISFITFAVVSMFLASCYYDSEEALYPSLTTECDTTNVTYSATISSIMKNSCTSCHSGSVPSGGITLTSYAGVQQVASNGMLLKAINGTGVPKMPPSGSLTSCSLSQIGIWLKDGIPNN
jgi:cytochrome c5